MSVRLRMISCHGVLFSILLIKEGLMFIKTVEEVEVNSSGDDYNAMSDM
ncbi:hypothetical protein [Desertibacillus haloalkaliphilus]|nr:hypothetical protein [Desertibacillus haloalkaliphilus]MBU8905142.1 hypothetical protein [Desertibacillus haloalkaliphilus]